MAFDYSYWAVSSLMHMDGSNGSSTFTATKGPTFTASGATLTTSNKKFGTAAGTFNGSSDYLSYATGSAFNFGTKDFTIEAWVYPTSVTGYQSIFAGTNGEFIFNLNAAKLECGSWYSAGIASSGTSVLAINTWAHVAVNRTGTTLRLYIDGAQVASVTNSSNFTYAGAVRVGSTEYSGDRAYFAGQIDDFRITGNASISYGRYPVAFTAPTEAHPDSQGILPALARPRNFRSFQKPIHHIGL